MAAFYCYSGRFIEDTERIFAGKKGVEKEKRRKGEKAKRRKGEKEKRRKGEKEKRTGVTHLLPYPKR